MNETVQYTANPPDITNSSHLPPTIRRGCKKITDAAIIAVAKNCPNFASLTVG